MPTEPPAGGAAAATGAAGNLNAQPAANTVSANARRRMWIYPFQNILPNLAFRIDKIYL